MYFIATVTLECRLIFYCSSIVCRNGGNVLNEMRIPKRIIHRSDIKLCHEAGVSISYVTEKVKKESISTLPFPRAIILTVAAFLPSQILYFCAFLYRWWRCWAISREAYIIWKMGRIIKRESKRVREERENESGFGRDYLELEVKIRWKLLVAALVHEDFEKAKGKKKYFKKFCSSYGMFFHFGH